LNHHRLIVESRNIEIVAVSDLEAIRSESSAALRQSSEAKEYVDQVRSVVGLLHELIGEAKTIATDAEKTSVSAEEVSREASSDVSSVRILISSEVNNLKHEFRCIKYELKKPKSREVVESRDIEIAPASDVEHIRSEIELLHKAMEEAKAVSLDAEKTSPSAEEVSRFSSELSTWAQLEGKMIGGAEPRFQVPIWLERAPQSSRLRRCKPHSME
jgi:hypothetical protein